MLDVHIGVDVGGTNTDAVVLCGTDVLGSAKQFTTLDVTTGVTYAISAALQDATKDTTERSVNVLRVHIGTTHFVNAVVQQRHLVRVAVIRLCGPASTSLPPFSEFPQHLSKVVQGPVYMLDGGYQFDGQNEIRPVNPGQVVQTIQDIKAHGIQNIVISGIFSVVNNQHEIQVKSIFKEHYPSASVTLSHQVGQMGILERENAAILNESLKPLCQQTVAAFRAALDKLGLTCPFYMTQNDGTLISAEQTLEQPVHTFASGPTNSMRGAAFLSGVSDAVVVDIGGTSTDVGMLVSGFPREASTKVKVGGVQTNFRMPDVLSIGLGGGSLVTQHEHQKVTVGPQSVGYRLLTEALVFGGKTLTASDIAVKAGLAAIGDSHKVAALEEDLVTAAIHKIHTMVGDVIDQVKISAEAVPVILVGGGSVLIDSHNTIKGTTQVIKPKHFEVANAVGAALSQVSGSVDFTVDLTQMSRAKAIADGTHRATMAAVQAGAQQDSVKVVDIMEVPLCYIPGNVTRVKVKVVGAMARDTASQTKGVVWTAQYEINTGHTKQTQNELLGVEQTHSATGRSLTSVDPGDDLIAMETEPNINLETGEWSMSEWDVECVAVGAGILGTGGGFSPNICRLRAKRALQQGKKIRVFTPERVASWMSDRDVVVPVAFMGAPTIGIERLENGQEPLHALACLQDMYRVGQYQDPGELRHTDGADIKKGDGVVYIDDYRPDTSAADDDIECHDFSSLGDGRTIKALMSWEAGGSNCLEPLVIGAETGLPIADCDLMGRAFPELQMSTNLMYGLPAYPATQADYNGRRAAIIHVDSPKHLENHFRDVCVQMGCHSAIILRPMTKNEMLEKSILHSISRAWRLGQAVLHARKVKTSPIDAILHHEGGKLICTGKICDVERRTSGGFARGEMMIEGFSDFTGRFLHIKFQNENLIAKMIQENGNKEVLACTPDLISMVDLDTGEPIPTEEVRYGLRVAVITMTAPPILTAPEGLAVVGPQAFGYPKDEVTYKPCGQYIEHDPVPPR